MAGEGTILVREEPGAGNACVVGGAALEAVTISDFLRTHAIRRPDHTAYIYLDGSVTWKELDRRINALAAAFWRRGVRPGDVVAVCTSDGPVQIEVLYATARIGAIRVGLNYRYAPTDVEKLVAHSGAKLIVVEDGLTHLTAGCAPDFGIITAGNGQGSRGDYEATLDFAAKAAWPRTMGSAIAQICYTTGSTGNPKGAVWRHSAVVHAMGFTVLDLDFHEDDVYLHCLPAAGVPSVLATWNVTLGFTSVIMPRFQADLALDLIQKHGCTRALFIPTMLTAVCEEAEARPRDVSSMRKILYGSASTPPALVRRGNRVFDGVEFEQIYGSTEGAGGWFTKLSPSDHRQALEGHEALLTSCGKPMIHSSIRVVDQHGKPVEPGEVGEICVAGDFVMDGYHNEEELTRLALRDGWLFTGDMGRIDESGYVYLVDRKQFMIITGGYNVYPIEIENVVASYPSVLEVCAFGIPDEKWGEAVHVAVVPRNGRTIEEAEIQSWCRGKLAQFKVPKSVEVRDALIRGATGKILKRAERDRVVLGR